MSEPIVYTVTIRHADGTVFGQVPFPTREAATAYADRMRPLWGARMREVRVTVS